VESLTEQLGTLAAVAAQRLLAVAISLVALLIVYGAIVWLVRRLAERAAAASLPGEAALPPAERTLRRAIRQRRLETVVLFATRLARAGLIILASLGTIAILVPELIAALGSLGVALGAAVGAALGFGAQQLVRDYLNGILILGENPYSVGDVVTVAGVTGTVEEVALRRTVVRDADGAVHSVPNGAIIVASNFTRTYARVRERLLVPPGTDIARATTVLDEMCRAFAEADGWQERFVEVPRVLRVDAPSPSDPGIPILVTATVRPGEQWEVAGEVRRRAIDALQAAGIELAAGRTMVVTRSPDLPPAVADAEKDADFT
jgi:small conductance mechanosensitive channel